MLSSEFAHEMGALIRSLESRVRQDPSILHSGLDDAITELDETIARLVASRIALVKLREESRE